MNKGTVTVIGANQGALAFACFAAENGFEVKVFEKKKREEVAYEWFDDMSKATFEDIGIECPPVINSMTTPGVTLMSPHKTHSVTITDEDNSSDIPVKRRELNEMLYLRAVKAGVSFSYECAAKSLIFADESVSGVILESGEEIRSDLTVDCSGAQSSLRSSLPDTFKIPQKINPEDMFFVTRTYFARTEATLGKPAGRRIYLKHLYERGISWCFPSHDGTAADVLIGRLGKMDEATQLRALADLKKENDIIGETPLFGGYPCTIPVRRPISRMAANGYALLGDSAYMTLPMNGSGMARSLYAAKMLADVISNPQGDFFALANLYRYQVKYFRQFGKDDAPVELIKNWMLASGDDEVDFLMAKGILNAQILGGIQGSPDLKTIAALVKSVLTGLGRPGLLIKLLRIVMEMGKLTKIAEAIPENYSEATLCQWQKDYESFFE